MQTTMLTPTIFWMVFSTMAMPFAAFGFILIFFRRHPKTSAAISITAIGGALACAITTLIQLRNLQEPIQFSALSLVSGNLSIPIGFLLDPLTLLMLTIVTLISFLVQVYSLGYMAEDPGFARYFAFMSLFAWAMISLTLSPNLLQLYVFWELVGLSSYLLIGFWSEKFTATQAGKKAFLMTRLGDISFLLGLLLVLTQFGNLNFVKMNGDVITTHISSFFITVSSLLIFGGIAGKSAQFPLLTWLPDAMEGPTPVSALLHSATMVAAGVFLFARIFPFFSNSSTAMLIFLTIGTISMLLASTMAIVVNDIKQVWAYSTISQLGFMIMGLSAGSYFAGVFHLTTHAVFKSLLFLCAGVFIHRFHSNDMFDIGKQNGRQMKIPMICMVIAGGSLSGLWPFSGFFSKEVILSQLAGLDNPIWLMAGLLGVFFTAYYTFRLIFIILFPKTIEVIQDHAKEHRAENNMMNAPLIILAMLTLILSFFEHGLSNFLSPNNTENIALAPKHWLLLTASGLSVLGTILAWFEFGRRKAPQTGFIEQWPYVKELLLQRWYMDRFYHWLLAALIDKGGSRICARTDKNVIDGGVHVLSDNIIKSGQLMSKWHRELIQTKLMVMLIVVFYMALYLVF